MRTLNAIIVLHLRHYSITPFLYPFLVMVVNYNKLLGSASNSSIGLTTSLETINPTHPPQKNSTSMNSTKTTSSTVILYSLQRHISVIPTMKERKQPIIDLHFLFQLVAAVPHGSNGGGTPPPFPPPRPPYSPFMVVLGLKAISFAAAQEPTKIGGLTATDPHGCVNLIDC